jgi:acylphosphatase
MRHTEDVARSRGRIARRYFISGRVQGVGFRFFAQRAAAELGLSGYVRNLDDGRVEVYAVGEPEQLEQLSQRLARGPRLAQVTAVDARIEAVDAALHGFTVR